MIIESKKEILNAFSCQQSGNCCRVQGSVYVNPIDMQKMATILGVDIHTFVRDYTMRKNGWTVVADGRFRPNCFLCEDNTCQVYDARPTHCRTYPDWPQIWASDEALIQETQLCPALKKAVELARKA